MANESNPFGGLIKTMVNRTKVNVPNFEIAEVVEGNSKDNIKIKFSDIEIRPEQLWTNESLFLGEGLLPKDKVFVVPIEQGQKYVILCKIVSKEEDE